MKRKGIWVTALSVLLVLVFGGMAVAVLGARHAFGDIGALDKTEVFDQTLDVTGRPTLAVDDRNGNVTITRGVDGKVVVHAIKRATTDDLLHRLIVDVQQNGNQVTVRTSGEDASVGFFFGWHRTQVDYEIQVPAQTDLTPVRTSNGMMNIAGVAGTFDLTSSNGTITATDFDGAVTAQTSNGRVTMRNGHGTLDLRTSNGAVDVRNVRAQGLELHTSNGRVTFTGSLMSGSRNNLDVGNGSVSLMLPPDSALSVDLRAGNGSVNVHGFAVTTSGANQRNAVQGVIGRPDATLTVRAGNGSVTLSQGEPAPVPSAPATPAAALWSPIAREGGIA